MNSKWLEEYDYLKKSILEDKKTYEEIGREYNCSGANIKKVALRIGIELPQKRDINPKETFNRKIYTCLNCGKEFKKKDGYSNKFCCSKCGLEYKHKQRYNDFLDNPGKYARANYTAKPFKDDILQEQNCKCAICGMEPTWNGKKLVFILDHIDGHASHNYRDNLRMICPNCDSQLDTYKSKNKCGERSYYRYHKNRSASEETPNVELP